MSTSATTRSIPVRRLLGVLAVVAVLATWWTWFRPPVLGGSTTLVTVSGTSMEPGMRTGDLAVVRATGDYAVGDVVAFRIPQEDGTRGSTVIHRIVAGDADTGFVLQGDNNDFRDPWQLRPADITGERMLHLPGAGRMIAELRDPVTGGALCAALTVFLVLAGGRSRSSENQSEHHPAAQDAHDQHEATTGVST